jgi:D-alanine-D-alanine ligase
MGGASSERGVSLETGRQIVQSLDKARYNVTSIDTADLSNPAAMGRPDVVLIALHGKGGEDGSVQGLLEVIGVPYTGSGILASALAMNKTMSKQLFAANGVPVIAGVTVTRSKWAGAERSQVLAAVRDTVGYPAFVKPNAEGSTFGCSFVEDASRLESAVDTALTYDADALIERYTRGVEITVGALEEPDGGIKLLPPVEIVPRGSYYDYESKYADGGSEHIIPARIGEEMTNLAWSYAARCHTLLGCKGMSRTDMIVSDGALFILEVNTIPGMTPTSLLPQAAAHAGISFSDLLDRMIDSAMRRTG